MIGALHAVEIKPPSIFYEYKSKLSLILEEKNGCALYKCLPGHNPFKRLTHLSQYRRYLMPTYLNNYLKETIKKKEGTKINLLVLTNFHISLKAYPQALLILFNKWEARCPCNGSCCSLFHCWYLFRAQLETSWPRELGFVKEQQILLMALIHSAIDIWSCLCW